MYIYCYRLVAKMFSRFQKLIMKIFDSFEFVAALTVAVKYMFF